MAKQNRDKSVVVLCSLFCQLVKLMPSWCLSGFGQQGQCRYMKLTISIFSLSGRLFAMKEYRMR